MSFQGEDWRVWAAWGEGGGPRNVGLIRARDGHITVTHVSRLRRPTGMVYLGLGDVNPL